MKYMNLVISWSACVLCDPICLNMVSKGQFMLCLVVLDHTKSQVEIFSLFWISPAERFWLLEPWSWAWWRGWRRWWSGWWRRRRTSRVRWFHTATKKDWLFLPTNLHKGWCGEELFIGFGALLTRLHVAWYCWCLQCLIWVCRLWAAAGKKGLTCISSNNSSSSSSRSRSCCAGRRSCSSFHSGNSPPLGPTLYTTCPD